MRTFLINATHVNGSQQAYYVTNAELPTAEECQCFLHWQLGNGVCNYPADKVSVREIFVRDLSAMYGKGAN